MLLFLQEKPDAVLPTMGGQTALNLAKSLAEVSTPFLASSCWTLGNGASTKI